MNIINIIPEPELNDLLKRVVNACFEVSNSLGSGFLEKVYERALQHELELRGFNVDTQVPITVNYKGRVDEEYIADLVVNGKFIVELKCCDALADEHIAQCINYLTATGIQLMLLVNFQHPKLEWRRIFPKTSSGTP